MPKLRFSQNLHKQAGPAAKQAQSQKKHKKHALKQAAKAKVRLSCKIRHYENQYIIQPYKLYKANILPFKALYKVTNKHINSKELTAK